MKTYIIKKHAFFKPVYLVYSKTLNYDAQFMHKNYCNVPPKIYELTITLNSSLICINFNN